VRNTCRDPRTVSDLWAIAGFSDGLFQPLMMAINDNTSKSMMEMRGVAVCLRHHLLQWSRGRGIVALVNGWLLGCCDVASRAASPPDVMLCAAAPYVDVATERALSCVSRKVLWNLQKQNNTTPHELSRLATRVLSTFDRFIVEYLPGGVLRKPSAAIAATAALAPTNNDAVELLFGSYDHLNSKVAVNMTEHNKEGRSVSRVNHTIEWLMAQPRDVQERYALRALTQRKPKRFARNDECATITYAACAPARNSRRTNANTRTAQLGTSDTQRWRCGPAKQNSPQPCKPLLERPRASLPYAIN
jgi:hypothetical protein